MQLETSKILLRLCLTGVYLQECYQEMAIQVLLTFDDHIDAIGVMNI